MACFPKTVVRIGVITALAGGAAVIVAGPQRIAALASQTRIGINNVIDSQIDDPIALRAQIKSLEAEYPKKIARVRNDLAEVQTQVAQINREMAVSQKVVALATQDLNMLDGQIGEARMASAQYPASIVRISFNDNKIDLSNAYAKREQIQQTRKVYTTRASELRTDLTYLVQQADQLSDLLSRLETERAEFQSKMFVLDSQIDTIARNDRLIAMMEERQATIDSLSRYQSHSLDQFSQKITTRLASQRAELEAISGREQGRNYVDEAEYLLDHESQIGSFESSAGLLISPEVIDIEPTSTTAKGPLASSH